MTRPTREGIPQTLRKLGIKSWGVTILAQGEMTVRSQSRDNKNRTHAENLPAQVANRNGLVYRDKLRAAIRRMSSENVFYMLDDAITLLPQAKLRELIKDYLNPAELCPDGTNKGNLLADVKTFQAASLSGSYYNGVDIDSENCTEKPSGTLAWIADCRRLLNRCVEETNNKRDAAEARQAFEIIFGLLAEVGIFTGDFTGEKFRGLSFVSGQRSETLESVGKPRLP